MTALNVKGVPCGDEPRELSPNSAVLLSSTELFRVFLCIVLVFKPAILPFWLSLALQRHYFQSNTHQCSAEKLR